MKNNILLVILSVTILSACSPVKKAKEFNKTSQAGLQIAGMPDFAENQLEVQKQHLIRIGHTTHDQISLDFSENTEEQVLSSYRLGKGDLLSIRVFGEEDFSREAHLSKGGMFSYPFLGELRLAGLTVGEVEKKIVLGLKGDYLIDPKVTVTVLEYRQLFVNGEVKNSGGYPFEPGMTINKALSLAGGFSEKASRDEIFIIRDGENAELPASLETYVSPGDMILVKEYKEFFINGAVKNAGSYGFIPNLTVEKAISIAGGFSEFGSPSWSKIFITRDKDTNSKAVRVELNARVNPGDMIKVQESAF